MRELGGLFICGTERHESRRIDNQLRGRSGRQGDPGESRFFLSAEDDVIRLFAGDRIYRILDRLGPVDEEGGEIPLEAKMLTRTVENAQKKVEEQNFLIRKRVLEYDDVMNEQRRVVYKYRREILEGRDMSDVSREELEGTIVRLVDEYTPGEILEDWDLPELDTQLRQIWPLKVDVSEIAPETLDRERLKEALAKDALAAYDERTEQFGDELMRYLERSILLQVIDNRWREHLYEMDYLREGIHLRGFAQIDPLVAYKNEGFSMFEELMNSIWEEFSKLIFHVEVDIAPSDAEQAFATPADDARRRALLGRHRRRPSPRRWPRWRRRDRRERPRWRRSRRPSRRGRGQRRGGRDGGQVRARQDRPQRPLLVRLGQEVQEVPRGLEPRSPETETGRGASTTRSWRRTSTLSSRPSTRMSSFRPRGGCGSDFGRRAPGRPATRPATSSSATWSRSCASTATTSSRWSRKQWWWKESDELADDEEGGGAVHLRGRPDLALAAVHRPRRGARCGRHRADSTP